MISATELSSIGVPKQGAPIDDTLQFLLAKFAYIIVGDLTRNLDKNNISANSKLRQSISIQFNDKGFELSLEDYYKYINEGVKGNKTTPPGAGSSPYKYGSKMPPPSALKNYIASKGISIKGYSDQRRGLRKSIRAKKGNPLDRAAFAMAKSIQMHGIRGTHFYSDTVNAKAFTLLTKRAEQLLGRGVIFELRDI